MKLGIMQPYFFPYIGYWQLVNLVDQFVIYDDVNYIKRGWINRNRILVEGKTLYFHVPVKKASQNKRIDQIELLLDEDTKRKKIKTIELAYKKAPYFNSVYPLVKDILGNQQENLSKYLADSLRMIADYLKIETKFIISSEIEKDNTLKAQDKIINICKVLGADEYYNAIGGLELYSSRIFAENKIQLFFIKTNDIRYQQFGDKFIANLSILDVMMFNSIEQIGRMLKEYTLIR